jgi:hypothetical protein
MPPLGRKRRLDGLEAPYDFRVRRTQRRFRIDTEMPRDVRNDE